MADQFDKLIELDRDGRIAVQVVPFDVGAHASPDGNFALLDFENAELLSSVVFIEGLTNNLYKERKSDPDRYREAVEHLHDAAPISRNSLILITEMRRAYTNEV